MKQLSVLGALALTLLIGVWGLFSIRSAGSGAAEEPETVISLVTDLSGIGAYWGRDSSLGAKIAVGEMQRAGKKVRLLIGDHAFSTTQAVSEVRKSLALHQADAVIVEFAPQAVAAASLLAANKTLFLNGSAAKSILKQHPYSFTSYLDYERHCRDIANHWRKKGLKKVAILKPEAEFAELCLKGAEEIYPGLIKRSFSFGDSLSSEITYLKHQQVEAIFFPALEGDTHNVFKAMSAQDFVVPLAVTKMDSLGDEILSRYASLLKGTISFSLPEPAEELSKRLHAQAGGEKINNIQIASRAYMFVYQLARAIEQCPEGDGACQTKAMNQMPAEDQFKFSGWKGRIADYDFLIEEWQGAVPRRIRFKND